ncbi:hypothetical protein [Cellulomonas sp. URHD0024]|uniref:hypothetical protein n=1 Tax=Cellulomonas sp. URHD0024 TaxID=1302620 RepID=UPI0003FBC98E|nr:hypothetical protein [Cellulomonas sp. URHD0024]
MTGNRRYLAIGLAALAVLAVVIAVVVWPRGASDAGATSTPGASASSSSSSSSTPSPTATTPAPSTTTPAPGAAPAQDPATQKIVAAVVEVESDQQHTTPVAPGEPAQPVAGVQVAVDSAEPIKGEAHGPGEVAGPAFLIAVTVQNATGSPLSLDGVVVNVYGTDGVAGSVLASDPRGSPVHGDLASGARASGAYVLTRPGDADGSYVISVSLGADAQTVLVTLPPKAG